jgi:predicted esterase
MNAPHQNQPVFTAGKPLASAKAAMILVHGRGATAPSILDLARALPHPDMAYLAPQAADNAWYPHSFIAPQAANHSWYPNSFLAPIASNEPGISSAIQAIADVVKQVEEAGISAENIIIGGFSQGACLSSEFVARNPRRYGGLLVFSGGLIGPQGTPRDYAGSLDGTPVFIGCSDIDFHIPVERVHETTATLTRMGAAVTERIYPGMGHTINQNEIDMAMGIVEGIGG